MGDNAMQEGRDERGPQPGLLLPPRLLLFDVNETLSDLSPMARCFEELGVAGELALTWFSALLRDGFALTVTGANPSFPELATSSARILLAGMVDDVDEAADLVVDTFRGLPLHPDVVEGVRALHQLGIPLATLSNGPASVAEALLGRAGIVDCFERLLSVENAPLWKPAAAAYHHGVQACGVGPSEAMLVAVHPWDVHGAHEAGLSSAWVDRDKRDYPPVFAAPDLVALSVVDLSAQLGGVGA